MASQIETIKSRIDVVEEIGLVVVLQKSGKSYKGLCPFHNERTPSFHVFPESQTWQCFGCHEGGDVFTFVEKQQSLDFREALAYLAEKAGVSLEEQHSSRSPEEEREFRAAKDRLRKLNEDALLWFHQALLRSRDAASARAYLNERGISPESVVAFSLGFAPDSWEGLSGYLLSRGYSERELVTGGLARERESGKAATFLSGKAQTEDAEEKEIGADAGNQPVSRGVYDYFRNRIIFPIRDIRGQVIGFGGRAMGDGQPKYLNSPQTFLFEKNNVLYALDQARDAIKLAKQVIIVEGYVDAVIAHQYGTKQTVACIGSAITEKHIAQLKKLTKQVTLALDPDTAGESATERGIEEALKGFDRVLVPVPVAPFASEHSRSSTKGKRHAEPRGLIRLEEQVDAEINVLQLPQGEDPDEFIRRDFAGWSQKVAHPLPLIDYYFEAKTAGLDLKQPSGKAEAARRLLSVIGAISDRIKRDSYIQKLSSKISIDERILNEELQRVLRGQRMPGVPAAFSDRGERRYPSPQRGQEPSGGVQVLPDARRSGEREVELDHEAEGAGSQTQPGRGDGLGIGTFGLDKQSRNRIQWEDYLIGLLLANPELSSRICAIITDGDFAGTDTRELYRFFNSVNQRGASPLFKSLEQAVPFVLLPAIERARKSIESRSPLEGTGLVKAAEQCATRIKKASLRQQNTDVRYLMKEAGEAGDAEAERQYRQQLLVLYQQLRTIDSATHLQG